MIQSIPAPPLLDLLDSPTGGEPTPDVAGAARADRLIGFLLAEYERIRRLDEDLGSLALRHNDPRGATAVRRLYQQWVDQADELLRRLRSHGRRGQPAGEHAALEEAVGRTLAMLSIPLDALRRADEQIARGETISGEEVRRELRASSKRSG